MSRSGTPPRDPREDFTVSLADSVAEPGNGIAVPRIDVHVRVTADGIWLTLPDAEGVPDGSVLLEHRGGEVTARVWTAQDDRGGNDPSAVVVLRSTS